MNVYKKLEQYKITTLGIREDGIFKHNGIDHKKSHILPVTDKSKNLLIPQTAYSFITKNKIKLDKECNGEPIIIKFHRYWHHLNSSQVLALNYFYEMLDDGHKLTSFLQKLGIQEIAISSTLEYPKEDSTEVDVLIQLENGKQVFIEVKYTEVDFGKATSKNTDYASRKSTYYASVDIEYEDYLNYYQLVRNISFAQDGNYTVFLVPRFNKSIIKNYQTGTKTIRNLSSFNTRLCYWEDLFSEQDTSSNVYLKYFENVDSM